MQILSHQSKIATQIELFVGHGDSYESAHFRRLGYLSLNSNERSKYQARELKSVYVNAPGQYLRMLVHKCYINEVNLFNQVVVQVGSVIMYFLLFLWCCAGLRLYGRIADVSGVRYVMPFRRERSTTLHNMCIVCLSFPSDVVPARARCVPQVGIVAVNLLGEKLGKLAPGALDDPPAPYGAGPRTLRAYPPGHSGREVGAARPSHTELNDLSFDMNFDPEAAQRIRDIANAKDRAARAEVKIQPTRLVLLGHWSRTASV